jgi:hypothetical protein
MFLSHRDERVSCQAEKLHYFFKKLLICLLWGKYKSHFDPPRGWKMPRRNAAHRQLCTRVTDSQPNNCCNWKQAAGSGARWSGRSHPTTRPGKFSFCSSKEFALQQTTPASPFLLALAACRLRSSDMDHNEIALK